MFTVDEQIKELELSIKDDSALMLRNTEAWLNNERVTISYNKQNTALFFRRKEERKELMSLRKLKTKLAS